MRGSVICSELFEKSKKTLKNGQLHVNSMPCCFHSLSQMCIRPLNCQIGSAKKIVFINFLNLFDELMPGKTLSVEILAGCCALV